MADISAFPTIPQVLVDDFGPTRTFIAGEALTAGMVVGMAATGVSNTVVAMDNTAGERPLGVAVNDIASGARGLIAMAGCIVNVAVADDTTGIDAGALVEVNDNAVTGTVSEFAPRADLSSTVIDASNDTTIDGSANIIGIALEDIAGDSYGPVLLCPYLILYSDHTVVG